MGWDGRRRMGMAMKGRGSCSALLYVDCPFGCQVIRQMLLVAKSVDLVTPRSGGLIIVCQAKPSALGSCLSWHTTPTPLPILRCTPPPPLRHPAATPPPLNDLPAYSHTCHATLPSLLHLLPHPFPPLVSTNSSHLPPSHLLSRCITQCGIGIVKVGIGKVVYEEKGGRWIRTGVGGWRGR